MLEKWAPVTKSLVIENWVRQLNRGGKYNPVDRHPVCDFDQENLALSAKALRNSVTNAMWQSIENDLPYRATGPEVFKDIIMKYRFINTYTIRTLTNELAQMELIKEPDQNVLSFSKKVHDIAAQIEGGSEHPPSDLSFLVMCTYLTATVELFRNRLINIYQAV